MKWIAEDNKYLILYLTVTEKEFERISSDRKYYLDEEFVTDMTDMVLANKGTVNIYFNVVDNLTQSKIRLFARQYRVKLDRQFYRMLRKYKDDGKLDFQIN